MNTIDFQILQNQQSQTNLLRAQNRLLFKQNAHFAQSPIQCSHCLSMFHPSVIHFCQFCKKTLCNDHVFYKSCFQCADIHLKGTCCYNQNRIRDEQKCGSCNRTFCMKHFHKYYTFLSVEDCGEIIDKEDRNVILSGGKCRNCHEKTLEEAQKIGQCYCCDQGVQQSFSTKIYFNCAKCKRDFCSNFECRSNYMDLSNERYHLRNLCRNCDTHTFCLLL